ncbi:anthocyanidin 3-O-glucosyltransferase 2 [Lactuca sativa]|nr:anthocyanidin 3-O-glucosyltransferase 2 [Lactuca sativa]
MPLKSPPNWHIIDKTSNQSFKKKTEMENLITELVFIPAPGVGHIMSTIEIAKLLVTRDHHLSITVLLINPPPTFGSCSAVTTYIQSLAKTKMDRISFIDLPQDKTPPVSKVPMAALTNCINNHCKYVRKIVANKMSQPGSARVAGFVVDMFCTGMIDVANEFNIPTYVFFTSNAGFLRFKLYIQTLYDYENQDIVVLSNSDSTIHVPSFAKPVPTKVFPGVFQTLEGLDFVLGSARRLRKAKAIIVNTFLELETHAIKSFSEDCTIPMVYPVGPILNLEGCSLKAAGNDEIITWLDSQPPSSVVFLCFGSTGSFDEFQVKEIANGLERSGYRFLWSLRRPPKDKRTRAPSDYEDLGTVLPEGFLQRTAGIGKVTGWVPQVAVLAHSAVGGFVSHCGWNSLLESLWFGVPSAAWPIDAEQQINAFEMVVELGLALEIKLDHKDFCNQKANKVVVTAEEIENGVRRLMNDKKVRTDVKEMREKSIAAVAEGGSSYASVGRLILDFKRNLL